MSIFTTESKAESKPSLKGEAKAKAATLVREERYNLQEDDSFVLFDATEINMPSEHHHDKNIRQTAYLPPARSYGCKEYTLKSIGVMAHNGAGKVIVRPDGNDSVEPDSKEFIISHKFGFVRLRSDGIRTWWIVG